MSVTHRVPANTAALAAAGSTAPSSPSGKQAPVVLHITGFGKFAGVEVNPTSIVVAQLKDALKARAVNAECQHAEVLEVSAAYVRAAFTRFEQEMLQGTGAGATVADTVHIWLHLGVAAGTSHFCVEQQSVNDATFRVPDAQGVRLSLARIVDDDPLGCVQLSPFPSVELATDLSLRGYPVRESFDAGRFLCNYCSYLSMSMCETLNARRCGRHFSQFIHVPDFTTVPEPVQVAFAVDACAVLIRAACEGVAEYGLRLKMLAQRVHALTAQAATPPLSGGTTAQEEEGAKDDDDDDPADALAKDGDIAGAASLRAQSSSGHARMEEKQQLHETADDAAMTPPSSSSSSSLMAAVSELGFTHQQCETACRALGLDGASPPTEADIQGVVGWIIAALESGGDEEQLHVVDDTRAVLTLPASFDFLATATAASDRSSTAGAVASASDRPSPELRLKLVIVVRMDLGMSPGKIASQCCHASLAAHRKARRSHAHAPEHAQWELSGEPIVILQCADGPAMTALEAAARAGGLSTAVVRDAGRTEVEPGSATVLAIGPALSSRIDAITGELRLL